MINQFLEKLGLSDKEAKVYLTLLKLGTNAVSVIANKAELTRTTVYSVLESLDRKRLVNFYEKNKVRYYSAEDPETIRFRLNEKEAELKEQKEMFAEVLPELLQYTSRFENLSKVRYFEGFEGIREIYEDTLREGKDKLAYSSIPLVQDPRFKKYIAEYLKKRTEAGMKVRAIFPDSTDSRAYQSMDQRFLRESRLVPADKFPFRSEINIYGNKMALMSLQSDFLHGVIMESEAIVETERSIFELAWAGCQAILTK